jgi:hypothetical protein
MEIPVVGISGLPLGSLGTNYHLDVAPMERRRKYYKGEVDDFPQARAVVSLVSLSLHVVCPNTKSAQIMQ